MVKIQRAQSVVAAVPSGICKLTHEIGEKYGGVIQFAQP